MAEHGRTGRRRVGRALIAGSALVGCLLGVLAEPSGAPPSTPCPVAPALRDVMVNQGLPTYGALARGKDTLVRPFLSLPQTLPSCADTRNTFIEVTGGAVTVTQAAAAGGVITTASPSPIPAAPFPRVASFATAPALDGAGDLLFRVPGAALDSATPTPFGITVSIRIDYQSVAQRGGTPVPGSVTFATRPGTAQPIAATVGAASNNPRLLIVPIGDASAPASEQFPDAAIEAVHEGIVDLSRLEPVRSGVADLAVPGAGIRYRILPATSMVDLGPGGLGLMARGADGVNRYCIRGGAEWSTVAAQLANVLQSHNSLPGNEGARADRVVGVLWNGVALNVDAAGFACDLGRANFAGSEAEIRVRPDTETTVSDTGVLLAHELLHLFGGTAATSRHSSASAADASAPGRAYSLLDLRYLATNRAVMNASSSPWNDAVTVFEPSDWAIAQCVLTPGATGCTAPGSVGTAAATDSALLVSGSSDGLSAAGTALHTRFAAQTEVPRQDGSSGFEVRQYDQAGNLLLRFAVPASLEQIAEGGPNAAGARWHLDAAVPFDSAAERIDVVRGGVVLHTRSRGLAPRFGAGLGGLINFTATPAASESTPAVSPDGALVAWSDGTGVLRVRRADQTAASATSAEAVAGTQPDWDEAGNQLVFARPDGSIARVTVDRNGGGRPSLSAPVVLYSPSVLGIEGLLTTPGANPSWDDASVVFESAGAVYRLTPPGLLGLLLPDPLSCSLLGALVNCRQLTGNGLDPSVSNGGVVAFERNGGIATMSAADGSGLADVVPGGTDPSWAGGALVFARDARIELLPAGGGQTIPVTGGAVDRSPALADDGVVFAVDRTTGSQQDIWLNGAGCPATADACDDRPGDLRIDVAVDCGDGRVIPVYVAVAPEAVVGMAAYFPAYLDELDPNEVCDGGTIVRVLTDGVNTVIVGGGGSASVAHPPTAGIGSAREFSRYLQYDALRLSGTVSDPDQAAFADAQASWQLLGPTGAVLATRTGFDPADIQLTSASFVGQLRLRFTVVDDSGLADTVEHVVFVEANADNDKMGASRDRTCAGASADGDPTNADLDYDNDGIPNRDDPDVCVSAFNASAALTPSTLNIANDTGVPVSVRIDTVAGDLRLIDPARVRITSIGGIRLDAATQIVAFDWSATSGSGTARFDRPAVNRFLRDHPEIPLGYVRIVVEGDGGGFAFVTADLANPRTCSGGPKCTT